MGSKRTASKIEVAEREAKALRLRLSGLTYREIGQQLDGISDSRACHIITRALARYVQPPAEELRALELARLDALQNALWAKAVDDHEPEAVRALLRVMQRRASLLGLDRIEFVHKHEEVGTDERAATLAEALRAYQQGIADAEARRAEKAPTDG